MSDTSLPVIIRFDTTANRTAFTPTPGVAEQLYIWLDSDDQPNAYYWDGANWQILSAGGGTGDVVGPASSTDEAIARFDGTTGKLLQDSSVTISNTGGVGIGVAAPSTGLHIDGGASPIRLIIDADNNVARILSFRTNNTQRWAIRVDGNETGADAGGDIQIRRYDDAGAFIDAPIEIRRSDGRISINTTLNFIDDVRQTFNPGANNAGLNVGSIAGDPATPSNGDIWYDSTANELTARINGSNVALGAGGSGITQLTGDVTAGPGSGSQAATIANDAVTTVKILAANVTPAKLSNDAKTFSRGITVDGGGSVVTTGVKGFLRIPVAATIIRWSLMADLAGDVEFDITKDDPGSTYPPTTSIVAAAPPTLSTADFDDDTTLTGWTTSVSAGDVIGFEVTGVPDTITRVTLQLDLRLA